MRRRMTAKDMRMMCGWQIGQEGEEVADLWAAFNTLAWDGKLKPAPILFPKTLPYGAAVGMAHYADDGRDSIELKANMSRQEKADTLLHEMIHQYLFQTNQNPKHQGMPWCNELIRLTRLFWGKEIWAAPSKVAKQVQGSKDGKQIRKSVRIQPESPTGIPSASTADIACWPDSFGLHVPVDAILDGAFKTHTQKKVIKKKATPAKKRVRQITKPKTKRR